MGSPSLLSLFLIICLSTQSPASSAPTVSPVHDPSPDAPTAATHAGNVSATGFHEAVDEGSYAVDGGDEHETEPGEHGEAEGSGHEEGHEVTVVDKTLIFVLQCALIGSLVTSLYELVPCIKVIPLTVLLFFVGGLMAFVARQPCCVDGALAHANGSETSAHAILFLLLPPLLYEAASGVDFHVFYKVRYQALMLAGPGVVVATGVTAIIFKYLILPASWSWPIALLIGSMLSATDPVAVVAALHELGAPKKLSIVIDAESLLNDGSAFVLFLIFKDMAERALQGRDFDSAGNYVLMFVQLAVGGPVLGLAWAIVFEKWLQVVRNEFVQVTVLLTSSFGLFYVAEAGLHVSGVLALVCYGLYMACRGKYAINPLVINGVEHVLRESAALANTIIFILAGGVVYRLAMTGSGPGLQAKNWGYLFLSYVLLHVVRTAVVFMLYPFLHTSGYCLNWKECLVMVVGGLRGAVGLALGLIVADSEYIHIEQKDLINFHVAGIVFLTTILNGTLSSTIYKALDIYPQNEHRKTIFARALREASHSAIASIGNKVRHDYAFRRLHWSSVMAMVPEFAHAHLEASGAIHIPHGQSLIKALKFKTSSNQIPPFSSHEDAKALCDAAFSNHVEAVQRVLASGADVNARDYDRRTALHVAASRNNLEVAQFLIEANADVNALDSFGRAPIEDAISPDGLEEGETVNAVLIDLILEKGGRANPSRFKDGRQLCDAAATPDDAHFAELQMMVRIGANVNTADYDKRTPLHLAAAAGNQRAVAFLLEKGAHVNAQDRWGHTPVEDAITRAKQPKIKIIRSRAPSIRSRAPSVRSRAPSTTAQAMDEPPQRNSHGEQDDDEVVELLLQKGAKVLREFDNLAALVHATAANNVRRMRQCVQLGADVNQVDYDQRSALHVAAANVSLEAAEFLLEHKADVNARDRWSASPLREAVLGGEHTGDDVEDVAAMKERRGKMVALLKAAGGSAFSSFSDAQILCQAAATNNIDELSRCEALGVAVDTADYDLRTALHLAAVSGSLEAVKWLLAKGAKVDVVDRFGLTPLSGMKEENVGGRWEAIRETLTTNREEEDLPPCDLEMLRQESLKNPPEGALGRFASPVLPRRESLAPGLNVVQHADEEDEAEVKEEDEPLVVEDDAEAEPESQYKYLGPGPLTTMFFNAIQSNYQQQYEARFLTRSAIVPLVEATSIASEHSCDETCTRKNAQLRDPVRTEIAEVLKVVEQMKFGNFQESKLGFFRNWKLGSSVLHSTELLNGYIRAHQSVVSTFDYSDDIKEEVQIAINAAKKRIFDLEQQFPLTKLIADTVLTASSVLHMYREAFQDSADDGLLGHEELHELLHHIDHHRQQLSNAQFSPWVWQLRASDMDQSDFFQHANQRIKRRGSWVDHLDLATQGKIRSSLGSRSRLLSVFGSGGSRRGSRRGSHRSSKRGIDGAIGGISGISGSTLGHVSEKGKGEGETKGKEVVQIHVRQE